ncbi:hypothetical protein VP01_13146g2, partial [Puccinia sorghi]
KTESVKALGVQLGRFVLVFCCNETFNFQAMGRIFVGIFQVGAWGCFDKANRSEERILSAVSQQIQSIKQGLIRTLGLPPTPYEHMMHVIILMPGFFFAADYFRIFITMNPGYAGRSNLPENLKKTF